MLMNHRMMLRKSMKLSSAVISVFGKHAYDLNINSTKSMTGHLLGAAGATEAIASIMAMNHGVVPPTINHSTVDENLDQKINYTFGKAQRKRGKGCFIEYFWIWRSQCFCHIQKNYLHKSLLLLT